MWNLILIFSIDSACQGSNCLEKQLVNLIWESRTPPVKSFKKWKPQNDRSFTSHQAVQECWDLLHPEPEKPQECSPQSDFPNVVLFGTWSHEEQESYNPQPFPSQHHQTTDDIWQNRDLGFQVLCFHQLQVTEQITHWNKNKQVKNPFINTKYNWEIDRKQRKRKWLNRPVIPWWGHQQLQGWKCLEYLAALWRS